MAPNRGWIRGFYDILIPVKFLRAAWIIAGFVHSLVAQPRFAINPGSLTITRAVESAKPFTVAGERGGIFGEQSGTFEAWLYPVKILSGFRITAELADYPVPIDVSELASTIEVAPAMTTITYSHAAFTIKQRMFAGSLVLFEIDSVRPVQLIFRFKPEMRRMWPAPNFGTPSAEWKEDGYYVRCPGPPEPDGLER
jgi:hypothetical protein